MIVTAFKGILCTDRDVSGLESKSGRLLPASDGMGVSITDTIIKKGVELLY
ncbi:ectoine synthase [Ruegeria arenilitoris]|uniref:ectoine synthase n=1 Tax=Ruegeria arenilitoris TaxID=1173585 RepID=UPI00147A6027|nr:ectoine synthase [Ruegeria arenilitoris]